MNSRFQLGRAGKSAATLVVFTFIVANPILARHAVSAPPNDRDMGGRSWPMLARSLVGLQVASPIEAAELTRYQELLALSDAQVMFLDDLHRQYLDRCQSLENERAPKILELAKDFQIVLAQRTRDRVFIRTNERWLAIEADFNRHIALQDELVFAQLETTLSDEQKTAMPRVRMHRERSRLMPPRWFGTPKSDIDLSGMIDDLGISGDPEAELESVRWSYEAAFTPVLAKATSLHVSNRTDVEVARFQQRFDDTGSSLDRTAPGAMDRVRSLGAEINELYAAQGREQLRLAAINDAYVEKLADAMAERDAAEFRIAYRNQVYRRIFPDHADPTELVEGMIEHPKISNDLEIALRGKWDAYRREYDAVNVALVNESDAWDDKHALTAASNGWKSHIAVMTELAIKRLALNEAVVQSIASMLPTEVSEHRRIAITDWRSFVERDRQAISEPAWQSYTMR